jgi:hypothetical protein
MSAIYISEEQDQAERIAISGIINLLNTLQEGGLDPIQTITSLLANIAMDQPAPHQCLKVIMQDTKAKMAFLRERQV